MGELAVCQAPYLRRNALAKSSVHDLVRPEGAWFSDRSSGFRKDRDKSNMPHSISRLSIAIIQEYG